MERHVNCLSLVHESKNLVEWCKQPLFNFYSRQPLQGNNLPRIGFQIQGMYHLNKLWMFSYVFEQSKQTRVMIILNLIYLDIQNTIKKRAKIISLVNQTLESFRFPLQCIWFRSIHHLTIVVSNKFRNYIWVALQ